MNYSNNTDTNIYRLQELMQKEGISFCIIGTSDPHGSEYIAECYKTREYMSGFTGSAGTLVVGSDEAALFVDGRYHIQADEETAGTCIKVFKTGINGVPTIEEYISGKISSNPLSDTDKCRISVDGRVVMQKELDKFCSEIPWAEFLIEDNLCKEVIKMPELKFNDCISLPVSISGETVSNKLSKVRELILRKGADGMFISALDDVCWLFNIRGRDVECGTVAFSYGYITKDSAALYLRTGTYDEVLSDALADEGVFICDYFDIEEELFKIKGKKVLADPMYTSSYFAKILNVGNELIYINNHEAVKKHIKNETEQELARRHHITDGAAVCEFIAAMQENPAADEHEAAVILDEIRAQGSDFYDYSFETISAYGENAAIVHYSAPQKGSKKLEKKGLMLVDSGAHYIGATTDVTRTFSLGPLTDEEIKSYTLVLKGNLRLMSAVFIKGTRCENLDILARGPLWDEGLDYRHGTGHGIGAFLNVHEGPYRIAYRINSESGQPEIEPGMIISDEPGYYEAGRFGIRHETQLLCVKKQSGEYGEFYGFEPLTLVPFDRAAIDFSMLNKDELKALKDYNSLVRERVFDKLSDKAKKWFLYNTDY